MAEPKFQIFFVDDGNPDSGASAEPVTAQSKKSAWTDPDDSELQISLADDKRVRKLRVAADENQVGSKVYESRLRQQSVPDLQLTVKKPLINSPCHQIRENTSCSRLGGIGAFQISAKEKTT